MGTVVLETLRKEGGGCQPLSLRGALSVHPEVLWMDLYKF